MDAEKHLQIYIEIKTGIISVLNRNIMEVYHVNHNPRLYGHSQPWLSDHDPHS